MQRCAWPASPPSTPALWAASRSGWSYRKWHFDPAQQHKGIVRVDPGGIELELNRYQREAEKFCQQNGVPFINLHRNVAPSRDNFVNDVILTDAGAAAAAADSRPG